MCRLPNSINFSTPLRKVLLGITSCLNNKTNWDPINFFCSNNFKYYLKLLLQKSFRIILTLVQNSPAVQVLYIIDLFLFYRPLQQATTTTQTTTKWEQKSKSSRKRLRKPTWKRLRLLIGAKRKILFLRNSLTIIPGKDRNNNELQTVEKICNKLPHGLFNGTIQLKLVSNMECV